MSLAMASSREDSFQTGQLVHGHGIDIMMRPADAAMSVSIATFGEPSFTAFTDPPGSNLQKMYLEEGPGCSSGQAERQVGSFLVTQPPLEVPEFLLPQRFLETIMSPLACICLMKRVQWPDDQASSDAFWGATMLLELSGGNLG
ncbi:hypothetical protein MC885_004570 [Smutsia gigantea]|nr:hypothetical protein MC885_004570 [Smutsia gigantea]